jgi:hypothetical protein
MVPEPTLRRDVSHCCPGTVWRTGRVQPQRRLTPPFRSTQSPFSQPAASLSLNSSSASALRTAPNA